MSTFDYLTPREAVNAARPDAPAYQQIIGLRGVDADRFIPRHERTKAGYLYKPADPWRAHGHLDRFKEIVGVAGFRDGTAEVVYADGTTECLGPKDLLCVERPVTSPDERPVPVPVPVPASLPIWDDLSEDNRTLPVTPPPFPTRIGVYDVIAAALVPAQTGELPSIAYMVLRDPSRPVRRAFSAVKYAKAEAGEWVPVGNGTHDCSYINAMEIFMERLDSAL